MSVLWIEGYGFRPAVEAHHRADQSDRQHVTPSPDADMAYLSKLDGLTFPAPYVPAELVPDFAAATPLASAWVAAVPGGAPYSGGFAGGGWIIGGTPGRPGGWLPTPGDGSTVQPDPDTPIISPVPVDIATGALLSVPLLTVALLKFVGSLERSRKAARWL